MEKKEFLTQFGQHIKKIRIQKGISGAEIARRCFIEKQSLYRIEDGRTNPTIITIKKLCEALDIDFKELFDTFEH